FIVLWLGLGAFVRMNVRTIPYSEFKDYVHRGQVSDCVIREDVIEGRIRPQTNAVPQKADSSEPIVFRTGRVEDPKLTEELEKAGIKFIGARQNSWLQLISAWIFPLLLIAVMWSMFSRRMGKAGESILSFGKSRAKLVADRNT